MTALINRALWNALSGEVLTPVLRIDSSGNFVGVDIVTTSAQAGTTGTKTFTIPTGRGYVAGEPFIALPDDGTANISMKGTVTSYVGTTLTVNITAVGSDTTTTKTVWRMGPTIPRPDHSVDAPYTRLGMRFEDTRTQTVQNSDMTDGTAGVVYTNGTLTGPGAMPSRFSMVSTGGLSMDMSQGTERGLAYTDFRFYGTTSAGTPQIQMRFETLTSVTHTPGSVWTNSFYGRLVAGSLTNVTNTNLVLEECNNASTVLNTMTAAFTLTALFTRFANSFITATAPITSSGRVVPGLLCNLAASSAVDFTVRIMGPQFEQARAAYTASTAQAGAASSITLAASASSTNNIYNGLSVLIRNGTGAGQTRTITAYNGSTKVATVDTAWGTIPDNTSVYSVYYTTAYPHEASSFIPGRTGSKARAACAFTVADLVSWFTGLSASEGTIIVDATPGNLWDSTVITGPRAFSLNDDSANNYIAIARGAATSSNSYQVTTGGVSQAATGQGTYSPDVALKCAARYKLNAFGVSSDGSAIATDTSGSVPTGLTRPALAHNTSTTNANWNGWIRSLRFIPRWLSDTELQLASSGGL